MAKVATGQKLDRLPPGKIFGMSVTEPKSMVDPNDEAILATKKHDGTLEEPKDLQRVSAIDGALPARLPNCSVRNCFVLGGRGKVSNDILTRTYYRFAPTFGATFYYGFLATVNSSSR